MRVFQKKKREKTFESRDLVPSTLTQGRSEEGYRSTIKRREKRRGQKERESTGEPILSPFVTYLQEQKAEPYIQAEYKLKAWVSFSQKGVLKNHKKKPETSNDPNTRDQIRTDCLPFHHLSPPFSSFSPLHQSSGIRNPQTSLQESTRPGTSKSRTPQKPILTNESLLLSPLVNTATSSNPQTLTPNPTSTLPGGAVE